MDTRSKQLTPVGKALVAWLAQEYADLKVPVANMPDDLRRSYFTLVLLTRTNTPEAFFSTYEDVAYRLMGAYISALPTDNPLKAQVALSRQLPPIFQTSVKESRMDIQELVQPYERKLTPQGKALVERIEKIVNDGLPSGVKLPRSVEHYLVFVEHLNILTPVAYLLDYRGSIGSLSEDVTRLEAQIEAAQTNASLKYLGENLSNVAHRLTGEDVPLPSAKKTPNWREILRSPDTFAAWQRRR